MWPEAGMATSKRRRFTEDERSKVLSDVPKLRVNGVALGGRQAAGEELPHTRVESLRSRGHMRTRFSAPERRLAQT